MLKKTLLVLALSTLSGCSITTGWTEEATYSDFHQAEIYADEESLEAEIDLKVGEILVQAGDQSQIYEVDFRYNELAYTPEVEFQRNQQQARLQISLDGENKSFSNPGNNRLNLRLSPKVRLNLQAHSGVGENDLDLTGLMLERLEIQSGVGETHLSMLESNPAVCEMVEISSGVGEFEVVGLGNFNFRKLNFRGGIGESTLDFSGNWSEVGSVKVEVGVGSIEIRLPRDIGAEVTISKGFFSNFEIDGFVKKGDTYYSENLDRVDHSLKIHIRSGIGEVEVRWI
jgi:hypothetical protein